MTGIVPKNQWTKALIDGFRQGLGFAKVPPFFPCEQGLEMILYIPLIL